MKALQTKQLNEDEDIMGKGFTILKTNSFAFFKWCNSTNIATSGIHPQEYPSVNTDCNDVYFFPAHL